MMTEWHDHLLSCPGISLEKSDHKEGDLLKYIPAEFEPSGNQGNACGYFKSKMQICSLECDSAKTLTELFINGLKYPSHSQSYL